MAVFIENVNYPKSCMGCEFTVELKCFFSGKHIPIHGKLPDCKLREVKEKITTGCSSYFDPSRNIKSRTFSGDEQNINGD